MDFFTAGVSMIAVQLCMALAMLGLWLTDRGQSPGAAWWAAAQALISIGIGLVLFDHGAGNRLLLVVANTGIVWGVVLQMWGLQSFFSQPRTMTAPALGGLYFLANTAFLYGGTSVASRVVLFSATMLVLICMTLFLNIRQSRPLPTLGSRLVTVALALVAINNVVRIVAALLSNGQMKVASQSPLNVVLLYVVPLIGLVLYSVGLLLLYFERSLREQRHLAAHDGLTGLLNRRAVVQAGAELMARSVQQREPLSVALVDIDFFKRFNDELGHHAGDEVLLEVAQLLSVHCRRHDLLGRYGGEEFLLVLPGMPAADCALLGERVTAAVRQYRHQGQHVVTISVGFASLAEGDSWTSLLSRADAQLYRAKALGRDQYCLEGAEDRQRLALAKPVPPLPAALASVAGLAPQARE